MVNFMCQLGDVQMPDKTLFLGVSVCFGERLVFKSLD